MTILNPDLLSLARQNMNKLAFVPAGATGGAGGPEAMAGPMPPMPGMGTEGDPAAAAGGGAPPPDAAAGGGGGGLGASEVQAMIQAAMQQMQATGAGGKPEKPKVDPVQEIYQVKKLLIQIAEAIGLKVDPSLMLGDPATDPSVPQQEAAQDPLSAAASQGSAISPIQPMQGASPAMAVAGGASGAPQTPSEPTKASRASETVPLHENGRPASLAVKSSSLAARLRATLKKSEGAQAA